MFGEKGVAVADWHEVPLDTMYAAFFSCNVECFSFPPRLLLFLRYTACGLFEALPVFSAYMPTSTVYQAERTVRILEVWSDPHIALYA